MAITKLQLWTLAVLTLLVTVASADHESGDALQAVYFFNNTNSEDGSFNYIYPDEDSKNAEYMNFEDDLQTADGPKDGSKAVELSRNKNQYVEIQHSSDFEAEEGCFSFWFNLRNSNRAYNGLIGKDETGQRTDGHFIAYVNRDLHVVARFQRKGTDEVLLTSTEPIELGAWERLTACWGPEGAQLYVSDQSVRSDKDWAGTLADNQQDIVVGCLNWGDQLNSFSDVTIYSLVFTNRQLTPDEIDNNLETYFKNDSSSSTTTVATTTTTTEVIEDDSGSGSDSDSDDNEDVNVVLLLDLGGVDGSVVRDQGTAGNDGEVKNGPLESCFGDSDMNQDSAYFSSTKRQYIEADHDEDYAVNEGCFVTSFQTRRTNLAYQGVIGKDETEKFTDGHFILYLERSTLRARFQRSEDNGGRESNLLYTGVQRNTWYHVQACFGPEGTQLYVDDELVDEDKSFDATLENNEQDIVIGALNWGDFINSFFDGCIGRVAFLDRQMTPEDAAQAIEEQLDDEDDNNSSTTTTMAASSTSTSRTSSTSGGSGSSTTATTTTTTTSTSTSTTTSTSTSTTTTTTNSNSNNAGWVLSDFGESCDAACDRANAPACLPEGLGLTAVQEQMSYAAESVGLSCEAFGFTNTQYGPMIDQSTNKCFEARMGSSCSATTPRFNRLCCCANDVRECVAPMAGPSGLNGGETLQAGADGQASGSESGASSGGSSVLVFGVAIAGALTLVAVVAIMAVRHQHVKKHKEEAARDVEQMEWDTISGISEYSSSDHPNQNNTDNTVIDLSLE